MSFGLSLVGEPLPLLADARLTALLMLPVSENLRPPGLGPSWRTLPGWARPRLSCQLLFDDMIVLAALLILFQYSVLDREMMLYVVCSACFAYSWS